MPWHGIVAMMAAIGIFCAGCSLAGGRYVIVKPSGATFQEDHAAGELADYLAQITGRQTTVIDDSQAGQPAADESFFIVGPPERNMLAARLRAEGLLASVAEMPEHREAFIVLSDKTAGGSAVVLLAGRKPIGSLYAVYDYLETYCGVGFFQDGEQVPHMPDVPCRDLRRIEKPRFDNRMHFCWNAHEAIKKYHAFWWTLDEWKREFDWMAKRRMNMFRLDLWYYTHFIGDAYQQAFPEIGPEVQDPNGFLMLAGFPHDWVWPPDYRRELTRQLIDYGRSVGVRFIYCLDYAAVPLRFLKAHPDYQYMPGDVYGPSRQIDPRDPHAYEVEKRYLQTVVKIFGTDHYYMYTPYAEIDVGGGSPEKNLEMRIKAANGILKLIEEVDPQGVWVTDSWDMIDGRRWNKELVKTYLDSFPTDRMYLYNTAADVEMPPLSREHNWWHGKKWAFGVINALAGEDSLRGDPVELIGRIKEAAGQPNCTGVFMVPEMTHYNVMFWDLVTHLAWQPADVDFDKYLQDYCVRRYGSRFEQPMFEAWREVVLAVMHYRPYRGESYRIERMYHNYPWYHWTGKGIGNYLSTPLFDEDEPIRRQQTDDLRSEIPLLHEAIEKFLSISGRQKDNPVYTEDAVVLFRTYAGKCFNWEAYMAYSAFKAGDRKAFEQHRDRTMEIMGAIRDVLALCPSYSINKTIAEACSVPGSNKFVAEMVRQACLNWDYVTNDVYEQFEGQYIPRMQAYFGTLESKLDKGQNTVGFGEVAPLFGPIDAEYLKNGWSPKRQASGDPVDKVKNCLKMSCMKAPLASVEAAAKANLREKEAAMRIIQQTPKCFDFDVILRGEDSPAFRILLPEIINAVGMDRLAGTHMIPGTWSDEKDAMKGTVELGGRIRLDVEIKKGETEMFAKLKLTNLLDHDLSDVYLDVCTSVNHLPGAPGWCNRRFMGDLPLDRDVQGRTWFEKITPHSLFALTDKGWVPMHPNPDKPDADIVPKYSFVSSKTDNAVACAVQSPDGKTWFFQAWNTPCRYMTPCPGNACMHLEPLAARKLPAGKSAEISVVAGMFNGTREALADRISRFRKDGR